MAEKGISPLEANKEGETPFLAAVRNGHVSVAQYLLASGAPLTDANKKGETVFDVAKTEAMREYLLKYAQDQSNTLTRMYQRLSKPLLDEKYEKSSPATLSSTTATITSSASSSSHSQSSSPVHSTTTPHKDSKDEKKNLTFSFGSQAHI